MKNKKIKVKSLLKQTTWSLFIIILFTFIIIEVIILNRSYNTLILSHDKNLLSRAHGISSAIDIFEDGRVEIDFADKIISDFQKPDSELFFYVYTSDLQIIGQSLATKKHEFKLPKFIKNNNFKITSSWNSIIINKKVRFLVFRDTIGPDPEDFNDKIVKKHTQEFFIIVGEYLTKVEEQYNDIFILTSTALSIGLIILLILSRIILVYNLKPLNVFRDKVKGITPTNLNALPVPNVMELKNIAETLNSVILNLKEAFDRERRFTSNVAHELRTPISEILTLVEVILNYPDELGKEDMENYSDILESVKQMQNIVNNLLILTKFDSHSLASREEQFDLNIIIKSTWDRYKSRAAFKRIPLYINIPDPFIIHTDREMFRTIIDNLISNAIDYSEENNPVRIEGNFETGRFCMTVGNKVMNLTSGDLPLMFERFWRKDEARTSDSNHCGLGLSLVRSLGNFLGFNLNADLNDDNFLIITISG